MKSPQMPVQKDWGQRYGKNKKTEISSQSDSQADIYRIQKRNMR